MAILARQYLGNNCYDSYGNYNCNSGWYQWGRWVLLGAIIVAAILFFFLFSCISARRRKRMGGRPMYGTGWASAPFGHGQATYNPNYQSQQAGPGGNNYNAPPTYQQEGGYYGENQGYFGGQQTGTELQQPQNTYRGGDPVYEPPTGPPPTKKGDGIIR